MTSSSLRSAAVLTVIITGLLAMACTTAPLPLDPGTVSATLTGPEDGQYTIDLAKAESGGTGFLAALDSNGDLVEIGPSIEFDDTGHAQVRYIPSEFRPDLAHTITRLAIYMGDARMYIDLPTEDRTHGEP